MREQPFHEEEALPLDPFEQMTHVVKSTKSEQILRRRVSSRREG